MPICAGEAQKIERIMEKFAERYCRDNPGQFRTADGAYVLSFALIMLNTDAHNPQADKKLSQTDFVNMCQDQVGTPFPPSQHGSVTYLSFRGVVPCCIASHVLG